MWLWISFHEGLFSNQADIQIILTDKPNFKNNDNIASGGEEKNECIIISKYRGSTC